MGLDICETIQSHSIFSSKRLRKLGWNYHTKVKQTLCENPTLNAIQSLLRSKINQQLLWDLYASIARDAKKTSGYYGNYMQVLQRML